MLPDSSEFRFYVVPTKRLCSSILEIQTDLKLYLLDSFETQSGLEL